MAPQPILHGGIIISPCRVVPLRRCLSRATGFSFASQEYWTDFDEICGRLSLYHWQINLLHLGRNCDRVKETGYTTENSNWRQGKQNSIDGSRCDDVKQMLTHSEWIHKFHSTYWCRCDRGHAWL